MGYFSNGTENDQYLEEYCFNCVNWKKGDGKKYTGCAVMDMHFVYARDLCNETENEGKLILDFIIPIRDDTFCDQCKMFIQIKSEGQKQF